MLVDTTARDTSIELFGKKLNAPICFSPVGINKIYHPVRRACSEMIERASRLT